VQTLELRMEALIALQHENVSARQNGSWRQSEVQVMSQVISLEGKILPAAGDSKAL
jgi:hypothetical protein